MAKKKNFAKNQVVLVGAAVLMILLNMLVAKSFDLVSALIYVALAALIGTLMGYAKYDSSAYLLWGALLSLVYNIGFGMVGLFSVTTLFMFLAAVQQALLGFVSAEIFGGDRK
jgi:hypothetical protein